MNAVKGEYILKKKYNLLFILFISILLSACNTEDAKSLGEPDVYVTFRGTIAEMISDDRAIVHWEQKGRTTPIFVNLSVNSEATFQVGDTVEVGFDGEIKESHPAQIKTLSVELVE
ncbi:DUF3221 domain-containing protein [Bacillus sp. AGMB 02131]|uniref:DUF3221 domain-containing protein n=1 Tax=Peribacillus faecalis TaxID=2772559 RepID=A0A927CXY5_9BACI|nr:DUF3221 domain-containing protein [Peribacillus faecalis]MBD3107730.1 DUF3221 domain-containing protein [Peribacillus faecalis]